MAAKRHPPNEVFMSELPDEHTPSFHIPIYDDLLKHLEVGVLTVMLLGVILATFINILDRNFQLGIWDYAVVEKMVYSVVFFIGLFGGVVASRRAKHIAIDAVAHFLAPKPRKMLSSLLQLICAAVCVVLTVASYQWIMQVLEPEASLLPARSEWYLNERLWRYPTVLAFGLMSLHFAVNGIRFAVDGLRMDTST